MVKRSKKYAKVAAIIDKFKEYTLAEALKLVKQVSYSNFTGTVEFHGLLNLPKNTDPRSIKVQVIFPHPFKQRDIRVAVAVPLGLKEKVKDAGADFYDFDEIKKQIETGRLEFDVLLAVPAIMPELAKFGKQLGPKGLMPNAKTGTIVEPGRIKDAVNEFKKGKYLVKVDRTAVVHFGFGTTDMAEEELEENLYAVLNELVVATGRSIDNLFKKAYIAPTMGPAIKIRLTSK